MQHPTRFIDALAAMKLCGRSAANADASENPDVTKGFRRLSSNELVRRGDFVVDAHRGFELWEGPTGFRADAIIKPIYRRLELRAIRTKKSP